MQPDPLSGMRAYECFYSAGEPEQAVLPRHILDMHDVATQIVTAIPDEEGHRVAEFEQSFIGQWGRGVAAQERNGPAAFGGGLVHKNTNGFSLAQTTDRLSGASPRCQRSDIEGQTVAGEHYTQWPRFWSSSDRGEAKAPFGQRSSHQLPMAKVGCRDQDTPILRDGLLVNFEGARRKDHLLGESIGDQKLRGAAPQVGPHVRRRWGYLQGLGQIGLKLPIGVYENYAQNTPTPRACSADPGARCDSEYRLDTSQGQGANPMADRSRPIPQSRQELLVQSTLH